MSKQISRHELAALVSKLLTENHGDIDSFEGFQGFMTDIAKVVCDHCGGEVLNPADCLDDVWYVGIHGNDSLPSDGGVWKDYDKEGELFAEGTPAWFEAQHGREHPAWPIKAWQDEVANGNTKISYWDWVAHCVESATDDLKKNGVTDYCGNVCGGGQCGTGVVCQHGINATTHMPG